MFKYLPPVRVITWLVTDFIESVVLEKKDKIR